MTFYIYEYILIYRKAGTVPRNKKGFNMNYIKLKIEQLERCDILFKTSPQNKTIYCLERLQPLKGRIKTTFNGVTKENDFCHYLAREVNLFNRIKQIKPGTVIYLLERGR